MDSAQITVPAARKDLKIVKRKRTRPMNKEPMDIETLLASLTDDTALMNCPSPPPQTKVCYYTPQEKKKKTEPRLLLRQAYKLVKEACAVVGLESVKDYKPSIYLVNDQSTVSIVLSDLISLRSTNVAVTVEKHLNETAFFKPLYMSKCIVEPSADNTITITNYHLDGWWKNQKSENHIVKDAEGVTISILGWNSLKRHFDCIESYYSICAECSATVEYLIDRYAHFFIRHYKSEKFGGSLSAESIQRISSDLPLFLQDVNEKRLPPPDYLRPYQVQQQQYQSTPMRLALLPWIDSEVRRYCAPNIIDTVVENLKYHCIV